MVRRDLNLMLERFFSEYETVLIVSIVERIYLGVNDFIDAPLLRKFLLEGRENAIEKRLGSLINDEIIDNFFSYLLERDDFFKVVRDEVDDTSFLIQEKKHSSVKKVSLLDEKVKQFIEKKNKCLREKVLELFLELEKEDSLFFLKNNQSKQNFIDSFFVSFSSLSMTFLDEFKEELQEFIDKARGYSLFSFSKEELLELIFWFGLVLKERLSENLIYPLIWRVQEEDLVIGTYLDSVGTLGDRFWTALKKEDLTMQNYFNFKFEGLNFKNIS